MLSIKRISFAILLLANGDVLKAPSNDTTGEDQGVNTESPYVPVLMLKAKQYTKIQ